MGRLQADAARDKLMGMFNISDFHSSAGAGAAARVRMCSGGAASAYLDALPTRNGLRMNNSHHMGTALPARPGDHAGRRAGQPLPLQQNGCGACCTRTTP